MFGVTHVYHFTRFAQHNVHIRDRDSRTYDTNDYETTVVSESPRILLVHYQSFHVQFHRQDQGDGLSFPPMQRCLDEGHCRFICNIPHLYPSRTPNLHRLRSSIGFFGDPLGDRACDIDLMPLVTQQLQPAQIAEKHER